MISDMEMSLPWGGCCPSVVRPLSTNTPASERNSSPCSPLCSNHRTQRSCGNDSREVGEHKSVYPTVHEAAPSQISLPPSLAPVVHGAETAAHSVQPVDTLLRDQRSNNIQIDALENRTGRISLAQLDSNQSFILDLGDKRRNYTFS